MSDERLHRSCTGSVFHGSSLYRVCVNRDAFILRRDRGNNMDRYQDISGQRFGRLQAVKCVGRDKQRMALWECDCDCGNTIIARGTAL